MCRQHGPLGTLTNNWPTKADFFGEDCQLCCYVEAQVTAKSRRGAVGRRARDRRIAGISAGAPELQEEAGEVRSRAGDVAEVLVVEGPYKDTWLACHVSEVLGDGNYSICVLPTAPAEVPGMTGKSATSICSDHLRNEVSLCPAHALAAAAAAKSATDDRQVRLAEARLRRLREAAWSAEVAQAEQRRQEASEAEQRRQEASDFDGCFAFADPLLPRWQFVVDVGKVQAVGAATAAALQMSTKALPFAIASRSQSRRIFEKSLFR